MARPKLQSFNRPGGLGGWTRLKEFSCSFPSQKPVGSRLIRQVVLCQAENLEGFQLPLPITLFVTRDPSLR